MKPFFRHGGVILGGYLSSQLALMLATFLATPIGVALSLVARLWSMARELFDIVLVPLAQPRGVSQ